jgi:hypothetical protein
MIKTRACKMRQMEEVKKLVNLMLSNARQPLLWACSTPTIHDFYLCYCWQPTSCFIV